MGCSILQNLRDVFTGKILRPPSRYCSMLGAGPDPRPHRPRHPVSADPASGLPRFSPPSSKGRRFQEPQPRLRSTHRARLPAFRQLCGKPTLVGGCLSASLKDGPRRALSLLWTPPCMLSHCMARSAGSRAALPVPAPVLAETVDLTWPSCSRATTGLCDGQVINPEQLPPAPAQGPLCHHHLL